MDVDTTSKRPDNLGQQQRARLQQIMEQDDPVSYKRKAAEDLEDMVNTQASTDAGPSTANHSAYVHPARRKGALKHETLSKRKKNKELSKREPKKIKKSPEEVQQLRAARERDRVSWAKKTKKGQPNLNSRMEVLLGKYVISSAMRVQPELKVDTQQDRTESKSVTFGHATALLFSCHSQRHFSLLCCLLLVLLILLVRQLEIFTR